MKNFNLLALGFLVAPTVNSEVLTTRVLVIQPPPPRQDEMMSRPPPTAIERDCARDIDYLCSENPFGVPMVRIKDPMLDWIMEPSAPLPIMDTTPIDQMLNDMMNSILSMPPPPPTMVLRPFEENHEEKPHQVVDDMFHSMLTSLAEHVAESSASADEPMLTERTPEEKESVPKQAASTSADDTQAPWPLPPPPAFDPIQFTKQLADHGHQILEKEENEDKRRLARRLTEVEPHMFRQAYGHLPFGCHKNRCLVNALEHGKTSPKCTATLRQSQLSNQEEMIMRKIKVQHLKNEQETFVAMVYIYGILVVGTMILVVRRFRLTHLAEKRRLKVRILQLVYNRPELKSQIEDELGEDLGSVPPFHPFFLARMGAGARERMGHWKLFRMVRFVVWVCLVWMAIINPFLAMFLLIIIIGAQFLKLLCCPRKLKEDCTCCYCGLSTADVKTGMHTDCHVCNGTGVCAPACDRCCDDEEDEEEQQECYQQTGTDGTIPPPPGTRRRGTIKKATERAYMGIPVQVV